jgi:pilus assembly protein Flp/PilA
MRAIKINKINYFLLDLYLKIKNNQKGATAVEYAIMVSLIAAVIVVAVTTLGQKTMALFETVNY